MCQMVHPAKAGRPSVHNWAWVPLMVLPFLMFSSTTVADKVITKNGQILEGLIKSENSHYIDMDIQGTITRMPVDRVMKVIINTPEENVRSLLDRILEAIIREDIHTAQRLIEQARSIKINDVKLIENLNLLDGDITDLEHRGGSTEQRRIRAEALLSKAKRAFDRIRTEEGNELLIMALRIDPGYEEAHKKVNQLLSGPARPDLLLAGEYFASALWINSAKNKRLDSPVVALLPATYAELAERFNKTNNLAAAGRYAELIRIISDAFVNNPTWIDHARSNEERALFSEPVTGLLSRLVNDNLERGEYKNAYGKLRSWADPGESAESSELFIRALIGAEEYADAISLLEVAVNDFPQSIVVKPRLDALKLLLEGDAALQDGQVTKAVDLYDQVYAMREVLLPEIEVAVGQRISGVRASVINKSGPSRPRWLKADVAAMIARYSPKSQDRRYAAKVFSESIPSSSWKLDVIWQINGTPLAIPDEISAGVKPVLGRPLHTRFNSRSPFHLTALIDMQTTQEEADLFKQFLLTPKETNLRRGIKITAFKFNITAGHPALGRMMDKSWETTAIPPNVLQSIIDQGVTFEKDRNPSVSITGFDSLAQFVNEYLPSYVTRDVTLLSSQLTSELIDELLLTSPVD